MNLVCFPWNKRTRLATSNVRGATLRSTLQGPQYFGEGVCEQERIPVEWMLYYGWASLFDLGHACQTSQMRTPASIVNVLLKLMAILLSPSLPC